MIQEQVKKAGRGVKTTQEAQAVKEHKLKERDEDLAIVKKQLMKSEEDLNTIPLQITYGFYVVVGHQYKVEVRPEFVDDEFAADLIFVFCQNKWKAQEAEVEDADPRHSEHEGDRGVAMAHQKTYNPKSKTNLPKKLSQRP